MSFMISNVARDTTEEDAFNRGNLPLGTDHFAMRINAETEAMRLRYHGVIHDPKAAHEIKMWARIHSRRMGIEWPESRELLTEKDKDEIARLEQAIQQATVEVAAFMEVYDLAS